MMSFPAGAPSLMRDLEIRVKDAAAKTSEIFDVETQTSIATRTLDADNRAMAAGFVVELDGTLDGDDKFNIVQTPQAREIIEISKPSLIYNIQHQIWEPLGGFKKSLLMLCRGLALSFNQPRLQLKRLFLCVKRVLRLNLPIPVSTWILRRQI